MEFDTLSQVECPCEPITTCGPVIHQHGLRAEAFIQLEKTFLGVPGHMGRYYEGGPLCVQRLQTALRYDPKVTAHFRLSSEVGRGYHGNSL